ncbi:RICIN domain-containing protein [Streptomyces abikoensis]|uniref:RICIN domain-containing protein n=1 Tax=Streptomyces abikoensis TaxID=97398 RepID=A0ABW7TA30_9ACTN
MAGALMATVQIAPASAVPTERVAIQNKHSHQCLEVADWSTSNGAPVRQWPCHSGANQRWYIRNSPEGSGRKIVVNANSGKCLDAPGGDIGNGSQLVQWDCNGGLNQTWWLPAGDGQDNIAFWAGASPNNQVMEINDFSTENGSRAQMWEYNGGNNQLWGLPIG